MKQIINAAGAFALLGVMMVFSDIGFAQCNMAVVDMQGAVLGSNEAKAQSGKFDARVAEWQAKLSVIEREISTAQRQLKGQALRSPEDTDAVLNGRIREKTGELTRLQSEAETDVDNYREFLLGPLITIAAEIANTVAAEKGIGTVVDSSSSSAGLPAGASKDCDFTAEVTRRINAKSAVNAPAK